MPASYPTTVKTFTAKVDVTDVVFAAHINDLQDEVRAIQLELGTLPKGGYSDVKARIANLESTKLNSSDVGTIQHNSLAGLTTGDPHTQYLLKSIGTAKGGLVGFSAASTPGMLGVGADGTILEADSGSTYGWRWGTAPVRHGSGTLAARPAASAAPRTLYYATDEDKLYYSNGTTWQNVRMEGDVTIRQNWNYTLPGEIKVASGATDYLPYAHITAPAGQTVVLRGYRWGLWGGGTSYTFSIEHYRRSTTTTTTLVSGVTATAASGEGGGTFGTPMTCNDNDLWKPVITSVSSAPTGGTIALLVDVTV